MIEKQRPAFAAMAEANTRLREYRRCQPGVDFYQRLNEDLTMPRQLAECKSLERPLAVPVGTRADESATRSRRSRFKPCSPAPMRQSERSTSRGSRSLAAYQRWRALAAPWREPPPQ